MDQSYKPLIKYMIIGLLNLYFNCNLITLFNIFIFEKYIDNLYDKKDKIYRFNRTNIYIIYYLTITLSNLHYITYITYMFILCLIIYITSDDKYSYLDNLGINLKDNDEVIGLYIICTFIFYFFQSLALISIALNLIKNYAVKFDPIKIK